MVDFGDIGQKLTFKENSFFLLAFSINSGSKYFFFSQQDAGHVAGERARTFMPRMETRASSFFHICRLS